MGQLAQSGLPLGIIAKYSTNFSVRSWCLIAETQYGSGIAVGEERASMLRTAFPMAFCGLI